MGIKRKEEKMKKALKKIFHLLPNKMQNGIRKILKKNKKVNVEPIKQNVPQTILKGDYLLPKKSKKVTINWIVPQPIIGSGGHRNIYRIVHYLATQGYNVTIYIDPQDLNNPDYVRSGMDAYEKIKNNFFDLECSIVYGFDKIEKCDVLFATHYDSAYIVQKNARKAKLCCYFIQDYECYFNPMSYQYLRAYNTYLMGFYPITSGPWPLRLLKRDFNIKEGDYFRFPINREVYYLGKEKKEKKIIFFAKPYMPRRCYQLGVEALEIVKKKHPEYEIVFYGSNSEDYQNVPFEFSNKGLLETINDLADLYRESSIGLAFSTTNPSLVPYEMMACGVGVIDLDFNDSVVSYESKRNISLAQPIPEEVAKNIMELIENEDKLQRQVTNALKLCEKFPTEKEMCEKIEKIILRELKKKGGK